jgi:hypothetical protein
MADEKPSLQIDTDWKKQAQEEKRKLAEQQKPREQGGVAAAPGTAGAGPATAPAPGRGREAARELPAPSMATLVQSIVTQALYHLGDLAVRGGEPQINLDMAKHQIDTLAVLEEKTANNVTEEEKRQLDAALYETRMRYVSVASQFIS